MNNHNYPEAITPETRAKASKVVLVGHCGFDQASLTRAVAKALPGVAVDSVYDTEGLNQHAAPDVLLLVNRVLDGRFDTNSGVDLISDLAGRNPVPRMMLISNFPDAQAQAVQAGALPGFGKNEMNSPDTTAKLQAVAGVNTTDL